MGEQIIHHNCKYYKGTIPCAPHKKHGVHCSSCDYYKPVDAKILIIKLGAIGDVIRTTPLIVAYKKKFKNPKFTWITLTPQILPAKEIDEVLELNIETLLYVQNTSFDIAINLDKEKEACGLLKQIKAKEKFGFTLNNGETAAVNSQAIHKLNTGLFDDLSKANKKSYCEEIFEICDLTYNGEEYLLDNHSLEGFNWGAIDTTKKVIGLNTGCGDRWTTRLWEIGNWANLAQELLQQGFEVILLGGKQEDERNKSIALESGAKYLGHFPLNQFINLVDQCDLVVTQVTMSMHLTIGLAKKIVLLNNIFNPHEFDLYNRGEIIAPEKPCDCFYKGKCIHGTSCMETIAPIKVLEAVNRNL
jgi:heptosyltransferase-2